MHGVCAIGELAPPLSLYLVMTMTIVHHVIHILILYMCTCGPRDGPQNAGVTSSYQASSICCYKTISCKATAMNSCGTENKVQTGTTVDVYQLV